MDKGDAARDAAQTAEDETPQNRSYNCPNTAPYTSRSAMARGMECGSGWHTVYNILVILPWLLNVLMNVSISVPLYVIHCFPPVDDGSDMLLPNGVWV